MPYEFTYCRPATMEWPAQRYGQAMCLLRYMEGQGVSACGVSPRRAGRIADMLSAYAYMRLRDALLPKRAARVRLSLYSCDVPVVDKLLAHASSGGLLPWLLPARGSADVDLYVDAAAIRARRRFSRRGAFVCAGLAAAGACALSAGLLRR